MGADNVWEAGKEHRLVGHRQPEQARGGDAAPSAKGSGAECVPGNPGVLGTLGGRLYNLEPNPQELKDFPVSGFSFEKTKARSPYLAPTFRLCS